MRRKGAFLILIPVVLLAVFYAGYRMHPANGNAPERDGGVNIHTEWINEENPPLPEIWVGGKKIVAARGSYTWCKKLSHNLSTCTMTDSAVPYPFSQVKAITVDGGSTIKAQPPERIKQFILTNLTDGSGDAYIVPDGKGVYRYQIHAEWFQDQGECDYYFALEVL